MKIQKREKRRHPVALPLPAGIGREIEVLKLRPYQMPAYMDRASGILVLHWGRQIGKSYTLAAWAVDRLIKRPGRLVTVLSNSRENGVEFLRKCEEACRLFERAYTIAGDEDEPIFENLSLELRARVDGKIGRIKILAANPRTARGFSGDLVMDEFAFHEDSGAIWEAAEPILSSNPDFLCRIASTGNGRQNIFHRLAAPVRGEIGANGMSYSGFGCRVSRVSRTLAYRLGQPVYDPTTRAKITPAQARAMAFDKRAYDQNYECAFADENFALLSYELIGAAESAAVGFICEQDWCEPVLTPEVEDGLPKRCLERLRAAKGGLYVGFDVARSSDLSVICVVEKLEEMFYLRALLRMRDLRLPEQQIRLRKICELPQFKRAAIDMTGLGLGLFEYAQKEFGASKIQGINFAATVPVTRAVRAEGRRGETARVTETLALGLLEVYEARRMRQPIEETLREDLRKPERSTTPGGRVSIAAIRDGAGHADHFWALALAVEAAANGAGTFAHAAVGKLRSAFKL